MTTDEKVRKTISGTLQKISFEMGKNGEFVKVELLEPGRQYPTRATGFDETLVQRFKNAQKGTPMSMVVEEEPGTYQGKSITYRRIINIGPAEPMHEAVARTPQAKGENIERPASNGVDRQDQIMLQHASGVVAQAMGDYYEGAELLKEVFMTFDDYIQGIAIYATWYLENVYQPGGYRPDPSPEEDGDFPF